MKSCLYCGRENPDSALHCRECGTQGFQSPEIEVNWTWCVTAIRRVWQFLSASLNVFGLVILLYAFVYCALVGDGRITRFCDVGGPEILNSWTMFPRYRFGVPAGLFAPIHELDSRLVRPRKWSGQTLVPNPLWPNHRVEANRRPASARIQSGTFEAVRSARAVLAATVAHPGR